MHEIAKTREGKSKGQRLHSREHDHPLSLEMLVSCGGQPLRMRRRADDASPPKLRPCSIVDTPSHRHALRTQPQRARHRVVATPIKPSRTTLVDVRAAMASGVASRPVDPQSAESYGSHQARSQTPRAAFGRPSTWRTKAHRSRRPARAGVPIRSVWVCVCTPHARSRLAGPSV